MVGGYLGGIDYTYPFLLTGVLTAIGFVVVWSFPATRVDDAEPLTVAETVGVLREEFTSPPIRSFVLYAGLFSGTVWMVYNLFLQPMTLDLGFSESHLGVIYAGLTLSSAAGSYFAGRIKDRLGIDVAFLVSPLLVGVLFVAVTVAPVVALPAFFVMQAADRLTRIYRNQYINDHTRSESRATVLSTASMLFGLIAIPIEMTAGALADWFSPELTVAAFGGLVLVGSLAILAVESPLKFGSSAGSRRPSD